MLTAKTTPTLRQQAPPTPACLELPRTTRARRRRKLLEMELMGVETKRTKVLKSCRVRTLASDRLSPHSLAMWEKRRSLCLKASVKRNLVPTRKETTTMKKTPRTISRIPNQSVPRNVVSIVGTGIPDLLLLARATLEADVTAPRGNTLFMEEEMQEMGPRDKFASHCVASHRRTTRDPTAAHVFAVEHRTSNLHRADSLTRSTAQNISQQDISDTS